MQKSTINTRSIIAPVCPHCGRGQKCPDIPDHVDSTEMKMSCRECGEDFVFTCTKKVSYIFDSRKSET